MTGHHRIRSPKCKNARKAGVFAGGAQPAGHRLRDPGNHRPDASGCADSLTRAASFMPKYPRGRSSVPGPMTGAVSPRRPRRGPGIRHDRIHDDGPSQDKVAEMQNARKAGVFAGGAQPAGHRLRDPGNHRPDASGCADSLTRAASFMPKYPRGGHRSPTDDRGSQPPPAATRTWHPP